MQTNSNDMSRENGFYVTVFNGAPGGGYSNAAFLAIKNSGSGSSGGTVKNINDNDTIYPDTYQETNSTFDEEETASDLASAAIFGSNSFLPSVLIQWVLLAIVIMIIIIIARRVFGGKQSYDDSPLKHA